MSQYYIAYDMNNQSYFGHSGVKGMKWGSFRWWTPDKKLTPAGREHYGIGDPRTKSTTPTSSNAKSGLKAISAIENGAKDYKTPKEKIEAVTADCWSFSASASYVPKQLSRDEARHRRTQAADLGLKALANMGVADTDWLDDMDKDSSREWFLWEDQTIGLGMIADLINQGYTAKQCEKLINIVESNHDYDMHKELSDNARYADFDIANGNWQNSLVTFAKECEKVKNK